MLDSIYLSLGAYFIAMIAIGVVSYIQSSKDVTGFMLGGRNMGPAVTALSAGASDMSGWILMGLPGLIFLVGINGIWMALGLTIGAYFNYRLLAPRLRILTEKLDNAVTIPEYLERRFADEKHILRILCAFVIIIFFLIYTTSGFIAGGKLFESAFSLKYETGLYTTAFVVVAYSAIGGFKAVSITDFVQGCIMLLALVIVPISTFMQLGDFANLTSQLNSYNPSMLTFTGLSTISIISAMSWGLGYFGQPHIIVRFMAIRSVKDLDIARRIGISWMILSILGTISVGICGAAYLYSKNIPIKDPETIFILLSNLLFNPLVTGFLLAAILAAIMSTISSQLLVSSSSITEDVYYAFIRKNASQLERVIVARLSVLFVALTAMLIAFQQNQSILFLVGNAWAGFGAAFGPVILASLFWPKMTRNAAFFGMLAGALTVLAWLYLPIKINGLHLTDIIYEIVPGCIASSLTIWGVSHLGQSPKNIQEYFLEMKQLLSQ